MVDIGRYGISRPRVDGVDGVEAIEALGFGALWVGGSPGPEHIRPYLERTSTLTVATGILNVWQHDPADVAAGHHALRGDFGDRFLLGLGIGHPEATAEYRSPLATMRAFLDGLDAAPEPVPADERILAALGPKMLALAGERSLGTHTYFTIPEHTRQARRHSGPTGSSPPRSRSSSSPTTRSPARSRATTRRRSSGCATTRTPCGASASTSRTSRAAGATA